MDKTRLEAFSDGVIAILITIMVFDLKAAATEPTWEALGGVMPVFACYTLSYLYLAIYWSNHHHLLKACRNVTAGTMWANLHLLFWLSLFPFVTAWEGTHLFARVPTVLYGCVLFIAGIAYVVLQGRIMQGHSADSAFAREIGRDNKGRLSPVIYIAGIGVSFWSPKFAMLIYLVPALMWLVPDRRVERALKD